MNRFLHLSVIVLAAVGLTSCHSDIEFRELSTVSATLNLSSSENDVWHTTRADATTVDFYYVLDANSLCQTAAKVNHAYPVSADKLFAPGSYNVFCITNADPEGLPYNASMIGTDFSLQPMVLNTLTDVSLGQQSLTIVPSKTSYDINVTVRHILAKLALSIAKVPDDISTIKLTLGNVSKTFTLDGIFTDDGTTLDINLQKAAAANADGTYDWTLPESLIYPCQSDASKTVIVIAATDSHGTTTTYDTSSTTVCSSGTRTSLTTTWRTLSDHLSYGYTETPWTATVQQGTFDM